MEPKEQFIGELESKIKNLLELRDFLQKKLDVYFGLFATTLRTLSGIKDLSELPKDKEERKKIIEAALEAMPITPENIKSVNDAIQGVVRLNKSEIEHFSKKLGKEKYVEDCQKVVSALGGKELILGERGEISLIDIADK